MNDKEIQKLREASEERFYWFAPDDAVLLVEYDSDRRLLKFEWIMEAPGCGYPIHIDTEKCKYQGYINVHDDDDYLYLKALQTAEALGKEVARCKRMVYLRKLAPTYFYKVYPWAK